jgi:hypothetical protein
MYRPISVNKPTSLSNNSRFGAVSGRVNARGNQNLPKIDESFDEFDGNNLMTEFDQERLGSRGNTRSNQ